MENIHIAIIVAIILVVLFFWYKYPDKIGMGPVDTFVSQYGVYHT